MLSSSVLRMQNYGVLFKLCVVKTKLFFCIGQMPTLFQSHHIRIVYRFCHRVSHCLSFFIYFILFCLSFNRQKICAPIVGVCTNFHFHLTKQNRSNKSKNVFFCFFFLSTLVLCFVLLKLSLFILCRMQCQVREFKWCVCQCFFELRSVVFMYFLLMQNKKKNVVFVIVSILNCLD